MIQPPPDSRSRSLARLAQPFQQFVGTEAAGGAVLLAAVVLAMLLANSPWSAWYTSLLETPLAVSAGPFRIEESLRGWINDAGMVLFFFLVGIEIKRELAVGELNTVRRAIVPLAAALGGMIAPAAIFLLLVRDPALRGGWGVPIATDVAFAIGVVTLLGERVPTSLKVFLLALAIFDDIGAVLVIAVFYPHGGVEFAPLLLATLALVVMFLLARAGVHAIVVYLLLGALAWLAMRASGVHPTLIGVAIGLITPWTPVRRPERFADEADRLLALIRATSPSVMAYGADAQERVALLARMSVMAQRAVSPIDWMERQLHHWVAFLIIPLFALANAGVDLRGGALGDAATSIVGWGVLLGLVAGKPLGIVAGTWVAVRLGAELPSQAGWMSILGIGAVAGIGFTVALFVAGLAYPDAVMLDDAKLGILAGSVLSGMLGYALLRRLARPSAREAP